MVNQAIVGGIAMGMFDLSKRHINERARGRTPRIAPEEIRASGMRGVAIGIEELRATLATASARFGTLAEPTVGEPYKDLVDKIQVGDTIVDEPEVESKG